MTMLDSARGAPFDALSIDLVEEILSAGTEQQHPQPTVIRVFGGPERIFEAGWQRWRDKHHNASANITYLPLAETSPAVLRQKLHCPHASCARVVILDTFDHVENQPDLQRAVTETVYACKQTKKLFFSASRRDPRDLRLEGELSRLVNDNVIAVRDWRDVEIRKSLHGRLASISPDIMEQLVAACVETLGIEGLLADRTLTDPETNLKLPPRPRTPFSGRSAKYGLKISLADFVTNEWGDYTGHHLLYTEHLRQIDFPLYKACYYQARQLGVSFGDYVLNLGMLAKEHVLKPPPGCERAAQIIQKARLQSFAQRLRAMADEIDGPTAPRRVNEILKEIAGKTGLRLH